MAVQKKQKTDLVLAGLAAYRAQVDKALADVATAYQSGQYDEACRLMSVLTEIQAQTSVAMRNNLAKANKLTGPHDGN